MRKTLLIAGMLVFVACWLSSCAIKRHRIESSDRNHRYWSRHSGAWYR